MILFCDRSLGVGFPRALLSVRKFPLKVEYHQQHFRADELDDTWLPTVGRNEWFVIGQDYSYHKRPAELAAIKEYNIGVFYLWGSEAPQWDYMRVFARAYDKIVQAATDTPRPFVYWIRKDGRLVKAKL